MSRPERTQSNPIEQTFVPSLQGSARTDEDEFLKQAEEKRGLVAASRIRSVITKKDVHIAYAALTLIALSYAFAQYVQAVFVAYATSAFRSHAQLAASGVVSRVFTMVGYAILPKLTDNINRISPTLFIVMILVVALSDAMMAGCQNVETYIAASAFSGMGGTAYEMTSQVYIAETTNIVSRAFWNVAMDSFSSIVTLYSGAEIGGQILEKLGTAEGWRWGYGMWCIINVVCAIPFIAILVSWNRRASKTPGLPSLPPYRSIITQLFHEYDIVGLILLVAGVSLILTPVSIAAGVASKWTSSYIAMVVIGFVFICLFVIWSLPRKYRPSWLFSPQYPLVPWYTLKNRSVMAMFVVNMFDFMSYGISTIYIASFLQVSARTTPAQATQIDNTIRIVFQVVALIIGLLMRFWTPICLRLGLGERHFHTRWPIWIGIPLCAISMGMTIDFVQNPRRSTTIASFVIARALYGIGRGMFQTCSQVAIQASAKRGQVAIATGIFYFPMSLGGAVGVATAGAIWAQYLPQALVTNLPADSKDLATRIYGSIAVAISYDPSSAVGSAINESYISTMRTIIIVATCLQVPMLIAMLFVEDIKLAEDEQVVYGGKRVAIEKKEKSSERSETPRRVEEEKA